MVARRKKVSKRIAARKANKQLILKALTDPKFRRQLASEPAKALSKARLTVVQQKEVELVLAAVKGIQAQF